MHCCHQPFLFLCEGILSFYRCPVAFPRDVTPADGLHMGRVECMCANTRLNDHQLCQYHRSGMVGDGGQSKEKVAHPSVRYRVEKDAAHEC